MNEITVFIAGFLGSFTGMLAAIVPVIWYVKKKLSNSPMGMFT